MLDPFIEVDFYLATNLLLRAPKLMQVDKLVYSIGISKSFAGQVKFQLHNLFVNLL
jgi:hypothetical protein